MTSRIQNNQCVILCILFILCSVKVCEAEETIPVHTVLEKIPYPIHIDQQQNVLAFATGSKIYVYDLDTGQRRWWQPCRYKGNLYNASFSKDYVVMYREDRFIALDKSTGNELWHKEMGDAQYMRYGYCMGYDTNWFYMRYEDKEILYNLDIQKGYYMPFDIYSRWGMMPDGETFYERKENKSKSSSTRLDVKFWKPGELQATTQFSLESPGELIVWGATENAFLVSDFCYKRTPEHTLRTHDAVTGEIIREFDSDLAATISLHGRSQFSRNTESFIWSPEEEPHQIHKLDIATGNTSIMVVPEGFNATYSDFTADNEENVWFLAWDKKYSLFLLPFNHDAIPRKLIDGIRFMPSRHSRFSPPYLFAYLFNNSYQTSVYRLADMEKLAEWPGMGQLHSARISKDARYGALMQYEENGPARLYKTYMYSREKKEPLFKVNGSPLAVSPDGHYLLIHEREEYHSYPRIGVTQEDFEAYKQEHRSKNAVHILDVTTKEPVLSFDLQSNSQPPPATFSEDGRYLVLCLAGILKILDMKAGFTEKILFVPDTRIFHANSLSFSPDNKRVLACTRGQAAVFNTATGKHINTFKETKKIVPDSEYQPRNPGFLKRVENTLRNFAGQFTDRLKNTRTPSLYSRFAKNGEQVVTVAENRLIRVWETETGRLIRTIDPELPEIRDKDGRIGNAITLSGNGAYAVTYNTRGLDDGTLWDLETGSKIRRYTFQGTTNTTVALNEDGTRVYALINDDLHFLAGAKKE